MKLVELTITDFVELLASAEPAPGGGSTAALNGALGAALIAMVCVLTRDNEKYASAAELAEEVRREAETTGQRFALYIDGDTLAFRGVTAVFAMPKTTEEEKAARREAMQKALMTCVLSPFAMMQLALQTLRLAERIIGKANQSAASDLGCAVLNLKAAVQGAWLNVCINLSGLKDETFRSEYSARGEAILAEALPLADRLYAEILQSLR